jgi:hypothetical protein
MADLEEVGIKFVSEGEAAILRAIGDIDGKIDGMMGTIEQSGSRISGFQGAMIGAFAAVTSAARTEPSPAKMPTVTSGPCRRSRSRP